MCCSSVRAPTHISVTSARQHFFLDYHFRTGMHMWAYACVHMDEWMTFLDRNEIHGHVWEHAHHECVSWIAKILLFLLNHLKTYWLRFKVCRGVVVRKRDFAICSCVWHAVTQIFHRNQMYWKYGYILFCVYQRLCHGHGHGIFCCSCSFRMRC